MTNDKPSQKIRKVWLPTEMKSAVKELCWRNRTKPSPYLASIIQEVVEHPAHFEDREVPPAGLDYTSVYITDEEWEAGVEAAAAYKTRLSAMVRVGIARDLTEAGIPWDVSTARPRKDRIPKME